MPEQPLMYRIVGGDQKEYGPVDADEMRQWISEGRLNGQSLARVEGEADWHALADFPEFADALKGQVAAPPPLIAIAPNAGSIAERILSSQPRVPVGECLTAGLAFFAANAGFMTLAVFVVWFFNLVFMFVPVAGPIAQVFLNGVLYGGLYLTVLQRMRGETSGVRDVLQGFHQGFLQLMLAGALMMVLTQIGFALCILPGVYLAVAWTFALPLVADKRLDFWPALELSRKVVTRIWPQMFWLMLLAFLPFVLFQGYAMARLASVLWEAGQGAQFDFLQILKIVQQQRPEVISAIAELLFWGQVILYFNLLFAVGALMHAYEILFGSRSARRD
jgi:hypothetical protein